MANSTLVIVQPDLGNPIQLAAFREFAVDC